MGGLFNVAGIVYGLDYRAYQNRAQAADSASILPDITVHPVSAYYAGTFRTTANEVNFYAYIAQNVFPHGNDATDEVFKATRTDAKAAYRLYRYQVAYVQVLGRGPPLLVGQDGERQARLRLRAEWRRHAGQG